MGGEQQYCRNKMKAMMSLGFDTYLFSCDKGPIYIDDLKKYSNNIVEELRYPPFCFSQKKVKRTVNKIVASIGPCSNGSIIESVNPATAEWAELVAANLGCKHFVFLLDEYFTISKTEFSFFWFKYLRHELMGIAKQTLQLLFKKYTSLSEDDSFWFDAACSNVVEDIPYNEKWFQMVKNNQTIKIGSIGRLEKGFVIPCLLETAKYIKNNEKKYFDIILIGGSDEKRIYRKIAKIFKNIPNAKLHLTGFLYPIPKELVLTLDVCFSTAGSALITGVDFNVPTISVDTFTGAPIGILNYTTDENMYFNGFNKFDLSYYYDKVLVDKYCESHETLGMQPSKDDRSFIGEVIRQLEFVKKNNSETSYYDISQLSPDSKKYKVYRFLGKTMGVRALKYVHLHLFHFAKMIAKGNTKKEY